ncbi:type IV pilus biogenesis protein PilM [Xanthomonas hydrangeae]|uniref:type IV pilus biogenesis protein PilM n=1 Tax=Xanthomonas hydrangeae TaxID=2775159 RepID=UPI00351442DF
MTLVANSLSSTIERAAHTQRISIAGSIAIYAKVASDYAKAHPSIDSAISPEVLSSPDWFNRNSRVSAYALNGFAYVYFSADNADEAGQIARACPKGVRCTVVVNGWMYEPGSLTAFASVPRGRGLPSNNAVMLRF